MPSLLRASAVASWRGRTRRRSTSRGGLIPWRAPRFLIHLQRLLWMCAAIMPTVSRGTPGTGLDQISGGRFSTRKIVARLFVRHAAATPSVCAGSRILSAPPVVPEIDDSIQRKSKLKLLQAVFGALEAFSPTVGSMW